MAELTLGERISKYRETNKLSAAAFADLIKTPNPKGKKVSGSNIAKWETGTKPSSYLIAAEIESILSGNVSEGVPEMDEDPRKVLRNAAEQKNLTQFFDAPATAGNAQSDMMPVTKPSGYIDTGDLFGECDAAIRIRGNSMLSGYPSGTILGLNLNYDSFIVPGELYVLETRSERLFKRLFHSKRGDDYIECYSDNTAKLEGGTKDGDFAYPIFDVHKQEIIRKFKVVGSAREHTNSIILYRKPLKEANTERDIQTIDV